MWQFIKSFCCCYKYEKMKEQERTRDEIIKEIFKSNCVCNSNELNPCKYCYQNGETGIRLGTLY